MALNRVIHICKGATVDVLNLLIEDHRTVEALFDKIETTDNPRLMQQYFAQIAQELTLHAAGEEEAFYPAVGQFTSTANLVRESYEEHAEVKRLINDISFLQPTAPLYRERIAQLRAALAHHIEEEEGELFPRVAEHFSEQQCLELGDQVLQTKKEAKQRLLGMGV